MAFGTVLSAPLGAAGADPRPSPPGNWPPAELLLVPVALFFEPALPTPDDWQTTLGLAYLGLIGAAFTYLLWFRGLSRLEPSAVAPLGFLSPVVAILLGWGVLDERLTPVQALGILVVLISVWLSQRAQLAPRVRPARA